MGHSGLGVNSRVDQLFLPWMAIHATDAKWTFLLLLKMSFFFYQSPQGRLKLDNIKWEITSISHLDIYCGNYKALFILCEICQMQKNQCTGIQWGCYDLHYRTLRLTEFCKCVNSKKKKRQFEIQAVVFQDVVVVIVLFFFHLVLIIQYNIAWNVSCKVNEVLIKGNFTAAL